MQDWISVDRDRFLALEFADFMTEFRAAYLPEDWEEITRIELLGMTQGDLAFWDFSINIQSKNALLRNTPSYLTKELLRHRIESSMNQKLALRCRLEKTSLIEKFEQWLTEVKRVDDLVQLENENFENLARATREATRCNNTLTEPSRRANSSYKAPSFASNPSTSRNSLPKLSDPERKLLYDNEGCLKCRCIFVTHRSTTCPNDFPDPVTYKPLTQAAVDAITKRVKKNVASIIPSTEPGAGPSNVQPVAVVMGVSADPVAYMPSNVSSVIEGDSFESQTSVSTSPIASLVAVSPSVPKAPSDNLAPFTVPHLFWQCSISGPPNCLPVTFVALIDHGSHTVLISEAFAISLGLKRRILPEPMDVEMAMPEEGKKHVVRLNEWVKLSLYDVSGSWTSKTVRAIIAPSLCAPVILGLPFLEHNNIVIDHAARTIIDKTCGFNLLHPPPPPPPKV